MCTGSGIDHAATRIDDGALRASQHLHRRFDLGEGRPAGRQDDRLAEARDVAQQRQMGDVARGDLVGRGAASLEDIGALRIEDRGEEHGAEAACVIEQGRDIVARQFVADETLVIGAGPGEEFRRPEDLQLQPVGARAMGGIDQGLGHGEVAAVVVADLGDDIGRRPGAHLAPGDFEGLGCGHGHPLRPGLRDI